MISDEHLYHAAIDTLKERGVKIEDIAELVFDLQSDYIDNLSIKACIYNVNRVLAKREVQNAILTGVALDIACEREQLAEPLQSIIKNDEGLYGIDEIIALAIVNIYGSIGFTNFGYLDKKKPKIIKALDSSKHSEHTHTFLDDIVGAIAAAAASRLAHSRLEN
ncbi:phosphatidylglycerophosphatase A family protein [Allofustis seminis]|uniref:phosphatidylglycerophosphatase A family protein n=1 Tax=Allofustis seminis TaxID=166939 RepID=UPI00037C0B33|nr:phosphatidylglycerophosphatase A [Allofustis seminis]